MKKWLAVLLLFITVAGAVVPCCGIEDCCAATASAADNKKGKDEGACSPFFSCATCPCFVAISRPMQFLQPIAEKQVHHEQMMVIRFPLYSAYYWQPPRTC